MSMESNRGLEVLDEHRHRTPQAAEAPAFAGGAQETVIAPSTTDALTAVPETYRPVATVRERAVLGEQPMYVVSNTGDTPQKEVAPPWLTQAWQRRYGAIRDTVVANFPPQREGLDTARGDAFVRQLGLSAATATIEMPMSEQRRLSDMLADSIDGAANLNSRVWGCYAAEIDAVFIFRSPEREAVNGPGWSEKVRLHELVHSSDTQEAYFIEDGKRMRTDQIREGIATRQVRDGKIEWRDLFISEGVPEMIAGDYVEQVLGQPHGLAELPSPTATIARGEQRIVIPSRYTALMPNGQPDCGDPAYAAAALDELVSKDPGLRPALIHSGCDPEAQQEVIDRLNAIQPGLHKALRDGFNSPRYFHNGLLYVRGALGTTQS